MMNENSPIWARLIPACTEVRIGVAGEEGPQGHADHLADDHHRGQHQHRRPVLDDQGGIDQHAHRDEEDGREHVAHRLHEVLDRLASPDSATSAPARKAPSATE